MNDLTTILFITKNEQKMPPKNPLDLLLGRNPARKFAKSSDVPIATCRWCLFKNLCLENEKNPTIRRLVLDEKIDQDELDRINAIRDCSL